MRRTLLVVSIAIACYAESGGSNDASPAETTGSPCTPGAEDCGCRQDGACDPGLVCADAQCVQPIPTTTSTDAGDTTTESSGEESTGTTSAIATTSSSEAGSSDGGSTGASCSGACLECHACAVAGPCAEQAAACEGGACGDTPSCMLSCAQQQYSCAECCEEAMLGLAVDLVECFAEQCGEACGFSC